MFESLHYAVDSAAADFQDANKSVAQQIATLETTIVEGEALIKTISNPALAKGVLETVNQAKQDILKIQKTNSLE